MDLVDKIIELTDLFDDNVVTTADKIPQPEPRKEVLDREAINRFMKDNSMADGGRIGLKDGYRPGAPIDPLDPQRKISEVMDAYDRYYKGPGKKVRKIPFRKFFEIYAKENFADGGRIGFQQAGLAAQQANIQKGIEKRKFIKDELIKKIDNFEKTKLFPKEKYKFNIDNLRLEFKADESTINKVLEELPKKYKNKSFKTKRGQSSKTSLTLAEKQFFADNYQKRTLSQMATDLTGKSYENKLTKSKNQQLYRYYLGLKKEGALEEILKGVKPKGTKFDQKSGEVYRKAQKELMNLDPKVYKDLTPSQLDNTLKKAIRFSGEAAKGTVVGAIDRKAIPKSLLPSFEHFQGITPGTITKDPDALRKVGITTQDFNFNVLGAKAKNNIFKKIKNELRTARESIKLGDQKTAKKSIETVNEIYDSVSKNLGTIDRSVLPKYSLSKNTIKETNIKPIKLGKQQNKIEDAIEQYVRFVAAGPKKDVKKIKQPNLTKAVKLVKKQDDKALKRLIKSRIPDIQQGQFFANPFFSPGILKEAFKQLPTPAAAVGLNLLLGVDPTSAIDRASIAAEAAFAPQLVKQAAKLGTVGQKIANLGLSPAMAARAARIASPIGIASLGLEGLYQGGKFAKKRIAELKAMSPEERAELRRQGEAFAFDPFQAAGGGIAKLAGDPSGAMLQSMNPDSQGLRSLKKRVKTI